VDILLFHFYNTGDMPATNSTGSCAEKKQVDYYVRAWCISKGLAEEVTRQAKDEAKDA